MHYLSTPSGVRPSTTLDIDADEILRAAKILFHPDRPHELRGIPSGRSRLVGAADPDGLLKAVNAVASGAGVYFTLSPVSPELINRAAKDADIDERFNLLIDADPVKAEAESMATDEEKSHALGLALKIYEFLTDACGWPDPPIIDSGNGGHLVYRISLPNDRHTKDLIQRFLKALAAKFDTDRAKVDTSVFNASRISKLPGTVVRKGPSTADRPHRVSRLLHVPDEAAAITGEQLEAVTAFLGGYNDVPVEPERKNGAAHHNGAPHINEKPWISTASSNGIDVEERARRYARTIDPAISGQGGHNKTFYAACKLGPGFDLAREQAIRIIAEEYNPRCQPPWSPREIEHKVDDAYAKETRRGWLLDDKPIAKGRPRKERPRGATATMATGATAGENGRGVFCNFRKETDHEGKEVRRAIGTPDLIADLVKHTKGWPKRVNEVLFVESARHEPIFLESPTQLMGWIDGGASVCWADGSSMVTQARFYEHMRKFSAEQFKAIETLPHYPALPETYYMHPAVAPIRSSRLLDEFISFFSPYEDVDRELIKALILTLFWGGPAGQRPAFRIEGPPNDPPHLKGRGTGKSTLAAIVAQLAGGAVSVTERDDFAGLLTRLLSHQAAGKRVLRLDNVKTNRLSWADLEDFITSEVISGKALYEGEGRRPNTMTVVITLNSGAFSKDMAQRSVTIRLKRPTWSADWHPKVTGFLEKKRWELIGEILNVLSDESAAVPACSRWAIWEKEVLGQCDDFGACQKAIKERAEEIDDDDDEAYELESFLASKLQSHKHDPDNQSVMIPTAVIGEWYSEHEKRPVKASAATNALKTRPLKRLKYRRTESVRGWIWIGKNPADDPMPLNPGPRF